MKKLIGYKLKKDCKQFEEAACSIIGIDGFHSFPKDYDFEDDSDAYRNIKHAKVLDLWFDKVYEKEETFKPGDIVVVVQDGNPKEHRHLTRYCGKIGILTEEKPNSGAIDYGYKYVVDLENGSNPTVYKIRKATFEEIRSFQSVRIGQFEVEKTDRYWINIGCKRLSIQKIKNVRDFMIEGAFNKISLDGHEIFLETIEKILKMK